MEAAGVEAAVGALGRAVPVLALATVRVPEMARVPVLAQAPGPGKQRKNEDSGSPDNR